MCLKDSSNYKNVGLSWVVTKLYELQAPSADLAAPEDDFLPCSIPLPGEGCVFTTLVAFWSLEG